MAMNYLINTDLFKTSIQILQNKEIEAGKPSYFFEYTTLLEKHKPLKKQQINR